MKLPKAIPEDVRQAVKNWRPILGDLSGGLRNYLKPARLSLGGENQLLVVLEDEVAEAFANTEAHIQELKGAISGRIGKEVEVKIQLDRSGQPAGEAYVDLSKLINMEITMEDEEGI